MIQSVNPATGEVFAEHAEHAAPQVEEILQRSWLAWPAWRERTFAQRAEPLTALARLMNDQARSLAEICTREMGKPLAESVAEVGRCVEALDYFAANAEAMLADEPDQNGARVVYDAVGPVFSIMPWNFPYWQVLRAAAPALMAGDTMLLKHAPITTGCALAVERLALAAGLPEGVFQALVIDNDQAAAVIADDRVRLVTLTGSCRAGESVAAQAGKALKKAVLELGGSDPFIVLADADLDGAVATACAARFANAGQVCIAPKRILVERAVAEAFVQKLARAASELAVGDPLAEGTRIGPMARQDLRANLQDQYDDALAKGARPALAGGSLQGPGFFFAPAVLADVGPGMRVFEEEVFGPLACVSVVEDADHALAVANDTPYGLGASVWTGDRAKGLDMARRLEAGNVAVNARVASDVRMPFGGAKRSGFGRELGRHGLLELVNIKSLRVG